MSAIIYAISIYTTHNSKNNELIERKENNIESNREDSKLLPVSFTRVYIIWFLEEVVIDGLNEVFMNNKENKSSNKSHLSSVIHNNGGNNTSHSY